VKPVTENYFFSLREPERSCLLYLREFILSANPDITESWKNHTPFYYYRKKWILFISYDPKDRSIYLSFVDGAKMKHSALISEGRKKMRILRIDASADIDTRILRELMRQAVELKK
jgi:hypothetical protein